MAHSPKMLPDLLESAKLLALPLGQTASTIADDTREAELSSALADQGIEGTELALDLILHDIAERARQATGASGAAIAIQQEEVMVCRAAAGATVPDLGARVNTQFGLSGACVRTGERQLCNDSDADERVDAEACRDLGIRSLVVVPVFAGDSLVGVFEVFSPKPQAFREQDMHTLQDLAQWVTEAVQGASGTAAARQQSLSVVGASSGTTLSQLASTSGAYTFIHRSSSRAFDPRNRLLRLGTALLALVLCSLLAFRWGWQKAHSGQPASQVYISQSGAPSQSETPQSESGTKSVAPTDDQAVAKRSLAPKPDAGKLRGGLTVYEKGSVIYQQVPRPAEIQNSRPERASSVSRLPISAGVNEVPASAAGSTQPPKANDVPSMTASSASTVAANPPTQPGAAAVHEDASESPGSAVVRVSQGVKEGRLIRRVDPRYPTAALFQRVEGSVVLQALIGKDGRVHELKAVNGQSYLTQAALEAVRQWLYEPYTLNGEPIDMKTEITVNFKLPK